MVSIRRALVMALFAVALPLQGFAVSAKTCCPRAQDQGQEQGHQHHAEHADHSGHDGTRSDATIPPCSACALCGVAAAAVFDLLETAYAAPTQVYAAALPIRSPEFLTAGLERPPRPIRA